MAKKKNHSERVAEYARRCFPVGVRVKSLLTKEGIGIVTGYGSGGRLIVERECITSYGKTVKISDHINPLSVCLDACGPVKVICYGKEELWPSREAAKEHYLQGMLECEGGEKERYANIFAELYFGKAICSDGC